MSTNANKSSQTLLKLALVLLLPIILIIILIKTFSSSDTDPALLTSDAIEDRIAPVAKYNTGAPAITLDSGKKGPLTGEEVYKSVCMSCHDAGLAGAPKKGDSAAWAPRIAQGEATLFKHALEGFNGMPSRGGNPKLSDLEVQRAVVFMANASGGKLAEPADKGADANKVDDKKADKPAEAALATVTEAKPAEAAPAAATEAKPAEASPAATTEAKPDETAPAAAAPAPAATKGTVDIEKAKALFNSKACSACHSVEAQVVGPAFNDVSAKYSDPATVAASIKGGSSGKWGAVPMPPNPVSDEEAQILAEWIVSLKN